GNGIVLPLLYQLAKSFFNVRIKRCIGRAVKHSELEYYYFKRLLSKIYIQLILFATKVVIQEPKTADKIANKNANLLSLFRVNSLSKYKYPSPVIANFPSFNLE